jgi:hypothetical protein
MLNIAKDKYFQVISSIDLHVISHDPIEIMMLRIAILECGDPPDKTRETVGSYGEIFRILLEKGASELNEPEKDTLHLTYWDVENGDKYPELDDIDAILMTGSSPTACRPQYQPESNSMHRTQFVRRQPLDP